MRITRTLLLALAAALATLALTATVANALGAIEAVNEDTNQHCSLVLENCKVVAHSEQETMVSAHLFGLEFVQSTCEDEFTGYFDEDGSGQIRNQIITEHLGPCGKSACGSLPPVPAAPWPFTMEEGVGTEAIEVKFCLENLPNHDGATFCTINVDVDLVDHHQIELTAQNFSGSGVPCHGAAEQAFVEVTGHWLSEDLESDEIVLLHIT
jgi:hypothetical protein